MTSQLESLDALVLDVAQGKDDRFWVRSQGQRVYIALAASRMDLLREDGYSVVQAIARLDDGWLEHMIERWQYATLPRTA